MKAMMPKSDIGMRERKDPDTGCTLVHMRLAWGLDASITPEAEAASHRERHLYESRMRLRLSLVGPLRELLREEVVTMRDHLAEAYRSSDPYPEIMRAMDHLLGLCNRVDEHLLGEE